MPPWDGWNTDFDDRYPIYQQIITLFCRSFARGEILPGGRIPSIRDMALILKVNANTIQRTYQEMERGGLISSKRGTGYFFTEDGDMVATVNNRMARDAAGRFLKEMRALGYTDERIISELSGFMKGEDGNDAAASGERD